MREIYYVCTVTSNPKKAPTACYARFVSENRSAHARVGTALPKLLTPC